MSAPEPPATPPSTTPEEVGPAKVAPTPDGPSPGRVWGLAVAAGLLAGLASFGIGEATQKLFPPLFEEAMQRLPDQVRNPKNDEPMPAGNAAAFWVPGGNDRRSVVAEMERSELRRSERQTATLDYAILGGLTGLALGLAGGLARRSASRGLTAGVAGLVLGAALGAAATQVLAPYYHRAAQSASMQGQSADITPSLLAHGGIWAAAGLAAGVALALGLGGGAGRIVLAAVGGLLGAILGTVIYDFVGAIALPHAETNLPLARDPSARALAHIAVALLSAMGAAFAALHLSVRRSGPAKAPASTPTTA